jgi:hypothetical protein
MHLEKLEQEAALAMIAISKAPVSGRPIMPARVASQNTPRANTVIAQWSNGQLATEDGFLTRQVSVDRAAAGMRLVAAVGKGQLKQLAKLENDGPDPSLDSLATMVTRLSERGLGVRIFEFLAADEEKSCYQWIYTYGTLLSNCPRISSLRIPVLAKDSLCRTQLELYEFLMSRLVACMSSPEGASL